MTVFLELLKLIKQFLNWIEICMQDTFARAKRARDDRVSCIQDWNHFQPNLELVCKISLHALGQSCATIGYLVCCTKFWNFFNQHFGSLSGMYLVYKMPYRRAQRYLAYQHVPFLVDYVYPTRYQTDHWSSTFPVSFSFIWTHFCVMTVFFGSFKIDQTISKLDGNYFQPNLELVCKISLLARALGQSRATLGYLVYNCGIFAIRQFLNYFKYVIISVGLISHHCSALLFINSDNP